MIFRSLHPGIPPGSQPFLSLEGISAPYGTHGSVAQWMRARRAPPMRARDPGALIDDRPAVLRLAWLEPDGGEGERPTFRFSRLRPAQTVCTLTSHPWGRTL
jgi:hypothetical protein